MKQDAKVTLRTADGSETDLTDLMSQPVKSVGADVYPALFEVATFVVAERKCSTSHIQRKFAIGYNKASRLVEALEEFGIVTASDHVGKREVVASEVPPSLIARNQQSPQKVVKLPMKETAADREVSDGVYRVAAGELRQFIERLERLDAEKKEIADQSKEVMSEAKGRGYDTKVLRRLIAMRKRDAGDLAEEEAVLEMYKECLGM